MVSLLIKLWYSGNSHFVFSCSLSDRLDARTYNTLRSIFGFATNVKNWSLGLTERYKLFTIVLFLRILHRGKPQGVLLSGNVVENRRHAGR